MEEIAQEIRKITDPKLLSAISKLELMSRQVVEGIIAGMHKSPYKGFSVEFADHREYVLGDELRYLDWKVYAKTDKYVIKEFEEETELRANFVFDTSNSMLYKSGEKTKLEIGMLMVASLSHLLLQQGDSVGLTIFDEGIKEFIPPRSGPRHYRWLLEELVKSKPGKDTDIGSAFHELAEKTKKRGLIVIISDLLDNIEKIIVGLTHFRHKKNDVIVFHILDRHELTFPFEDMTLFKGLEPAPDVLIEPWQVRAEYLNELEKFVSQLKKACQEKFIDYIQIVTDEPIELSLSRYLTTRKVR